MSTFPIDIDGVTYPNASSLAGHLEAWAQAGKKEHRGQRHPADRFDRVAPLGTPQCEAVADAAALLLASSTDPRVLELVAHLTLPGHSALYSALLARLEGKGPPLPDGQSMTHGTLWDHLVHQLTEWLPADRSPFVDRARALHIAHGRDDLRLSFLIRTKAAPAEITEALKCAAASVDTRPFLGVHALLHLLRTASDQQTLDAAAGLSEISSTTKRYIADTLTELAPEWSKRSGSRLRSSLKI